MVTSNFDKFRLLLWKNWILQWNHKFQLIVELLLPAIFSLLLVLVRTLVDPEIMDVTVYKEPLPLDNLDLLRTLYGRSSFVNSIKKQAFKTRYHDAAQLNTPSLQYHLAYTPNTSSILESIIKDAAGNLNLNYSGYADPEAMENYLITTNSLAGVEFEDSLGFATSYPEQLNYKLRFPSELRTKSAANPVLMTWYTNRQFSNVDRVGPRNRDDPDGGIPSGYLREGFLAVQNAITTAFITQAANDPSLKLPKVYLQRYPYQAYIDDPLLDALTGLMGLIILLSYIYPCTYTVKYITSEKEMQLKEVMKIMGLQNWIHWLAWFVKAFIMMGISAFLITLILTVKWKDNVAVLTYSAFSPVFFFFVVYTTTTITLCFMLATFFAKASTAAAVTGLIWFIMYIPYTFFQVNYDGMSLGSKMGWSLISNTAMGLGLRLIGANEADGEGLQWSNMFTQVSIDDTMSVGLVIIMMLVSCVIHMTICLYMEQIYPGEFGVPKKWNFPFTKSFWYGELEYDGIEDSSSNIKREHPDAFEKEPIGTPVGLQIKNLTKKFGKKTAVNNVSMNMYENEITVLLGHNGAGKTTTISMLTGMFQPTSGTAIINGCDIRKNIDGARMSLGICPQHNILFDDLTVRDHLIFYGRLKGLKGDALEAEVKKYIKKIELENKANVQSSQLSGGMKRKLSVCAAFCGGTKVVLCDEPSSGMDPAARRQLWNLLQAEKAGRTVLLTTHFMDEADVLGDRIAIMSAGDLKCVGTSFFLKKKFGSGYHLICVKKDGCDSSVVTNLLRKYIPNIQPEADIGAELSYQLPDKYSSTFETMFQNLESQSDQLNLNGYGVSITSLEEVFMRVGSDDSDEAKAAQKPIVNSAGFLSEDGESMHSDNMFSDRERLLSGTNLMLSQWRSMLMKKYLYTIRNRLLCAIQTFMPILFISMTFIVATLSHYAALKPLLLDLIIFPGSITVLETTSNVKDGSLAAKISNNYKNVVQSLGPGHQLEETGNMNFIDYMLQLGKTIQTRINSRYISSATVDDGSITAWLNNKPLHSAPMTLNLIHNAMARTAIGPNASVSVTNYPLRYAPTAVLQMLSTGQNVGAQMASNMCFCMCFVTGLYILFLIKERQTRAKLLQFVSGIRVLTFWLSHWVWDIITFAVILVCIAITYACFQEDGYASFHEIGRNIALFLLFGVSVLPYTYVMAGLFSEPATGFARFSIINIFAGNAMFVILLIMNIEHLGVQDVANVLEKIFLISPHFALAQGIYKLYMNGETRKNCAKLNPLPDSIRCKYLPVCCKEITYFAWESPGVLRETIYLTITGIAFFALLIFMEYRVLDGIMNRIRQKKIKSPPPPEDGYFDQDVEREKERVKNMTPSEIAVENLVLDRVTKFYRHFVAVNQISLAVKHSECFGLLGVNGAGKTTTFKMMTGDEKISSGEAYVKGLSLRTDMNQVYQEIGYCPQFDALFEDFTGREVLKIYSLLRGVPEKRISQISMDLARGFGFMKHYNKQVHAYSGGNKRKLSAAIAVLGGPSVIYLDEPTTGMDPGARRQLWNMVCRIRDSGKSIVLTSHSMEECEALCTRLAIMVNGELKCIGSPQHLKNKFTKGLILKLKMKRDDALSRSFADNESKEQKAVSMNLLEEDIKNVMIFIKNEFPEAYLQERFQGILTFYIPLSSILWSKIFGLMERNKASLNIEDYSISQTTLEEIFLQFAKYQREDPREINIHVGFCKKCVKWIRAKM